MQAPVLWHRTAAVALGVIELKSGLMLGKRLLLLNTGRVKLWARDGCQKFEVVSKRRRDSVEKGKLSYYHRLSLVHRKAGLTCLTPQDSVDHLLQKYGHA